MGWNVNFVSYVIRRHALASTTIDFTNGLRSRRNTCGAYDSHHELEVILCLVPYLLLLAGALRVYDSVSVSVVCMPKEPQTGEYF
jgi:hypothetical protein